MISWGLPRFHRRVKAAIRVVTTVAIQPLRVTTREGRREGRPSTARSCSRVRGWGLSSAGAAVSACDDAAWSPAGAWLPACDDAEAPDGAAPPC